MKNCIAKGKKRLSHRDEMHVKFSTLNYHTNRNYTNLLKDSLTSQKTKSTNQHILCCISVSTCCMERWWEDQILYSSYGIHFWNSLIVPRHMLSSISFTSYSSFTFLTAPIFTGMMHKVVVFLQLQQCSTCAGLSTTDALSASVHCR